MTPRNDLKINFSSQEKSLEEKFIQLKNLEDQLRFSKVQHTVAGQIFTSADDQAKYDAIPKQIETTKQDITTLIKTMSDQRIQDSIQKNLTTKDAIKIEQQELQKQMAAIATTVSEYKKITRYDLDKKTLDAYDNAKNNLNIFYQSYSKDPKLLNAARNFIHSNSIALSHEEIKVWKTIKLFEHQITDERFLDLILEAKIKEKNHELYPDEQSLLFKHAVLSHRLNDLTHQLRLILNDEKEKSLKAAADTKASQEIEHNKKAFIASIDKADKAPLEAADTVKELECIRKTLGNTQELLSYIDPLIIKHKKFAIIYAAEVNLTDCRNALIPYAFEKDKSDWALKKKKPFFTNQQNWDIATSVSKHILQTLAVIDDEKNTPEEKINAIEKMLPTFADCIRQFSEKGDKSDDKLKVIIKTLEKHFREIDTARKELLGLKPAYLPSTKLSNSLHSTFQTSADMRTAIDMAKPDANKPSKR